MKHLALFTAFAASACAIDSEDPAELDVTAVEQGVTIRGCDVTVDLTGQSTSQTIGFHGARYYNYNCDKIYFHIYTGGRNWDVTATQVDDAGSAYTPCVDEHLRGYLDRVAPSTPGSLGMTEDWGSATYLSGYWPDAAIYACTPPSITRGLGATKHYQFGVIAQGDQLNSSGHYDTVYKNFNITFSPI